MLWINFFYIEIINRPIVNCYIVRHILSYAMNASKYE